MSEHALCDGKGCNKCQPSLCEDLCPECLNGKLTKLDTYQYNDLVDCSNCHKIFKVSDER